PGVKIPTVTVSPGFGASPLTGNVRTTWGAASSPTFLACPSSAFVTREARFAPNPSCTPASRTWSTRQGPASMTVTGTLDPSATKTRVMPTFRPINPAVIALLNLDLDVDARRKIQLGQGVHRLRTRVVDIEQPLVGAKLELLAALLVDVR